MTRAAQLDRDGVYERAVGSAIRWRRVSRVSLGGDLIGYRRRLGELNEQAGPLRAAPNHPRADLHRGRAGLGGSRARPAGRRAGLQSRRAGLCDSRVAIAAVPQQVLLLTGRRSSGAGSGRNCHVGRK
jgi:hypothetical protein